MYFNSVIYKYEDIFFYNNEKTARHTSVFRGFLRQLQGK